MSKIRLSEAQIGWLRVLSAMAAPLCCPGTELRTYKALANRGLATKEHWEGEPCDGWVITAAGRTWLAS